MRLPETTHIKDPATKEWARALTDALYRLARDMRAGEVYLPSVAYADLGSAKPVRGAAVFLRDHPDGNPSILVGSGTNWVRFTPGVPL